MDEDERERFASNIDSASEEIKSDMALIKEAAKKRGEEPEAVNLMAVASFLGTAVAALGRADDELRDFKPDGINGEAHAEKKENHER